MYAPLLLLALISVPPADTQRRELAPRASFDRCLAASEGVTVEMLNCIGAEYDYQDARLNALYKRVMARLSPARQAELRASERQWLRTREPGCMAEAKKAGDGTLGQVVRNQCMLDSLIDRIEFVQRYPR